MLVAISLFLSSFSSSLLLYSSVVIVISLTSRSSSFFYSALPPAPLHTWLIHIRNVCAKTTLAKKEPEKTTQIQVNGLIPLCPSILLPSCPVERGEVPERNREYIPPNNLRKLRFLMFLLVFMSPFFSGLGSVRGQQRL